MATRKAKKSKLPDGVPPRGREWLEHHLGQKGMTLAPKKGGRRTALKAKKKGR